MKVIIAGGGTGGHLFPGIAIAEEFMKREKSSQILFIGSKKGIERIVVPEEGFPLRAIMIEGIIARSIGRKIGALLKVPISILQSFSILMQYRPDIVVGVGGYASFPPVFSSRLLGIPTLIHEQNRVPGLSNKVLAKLAKKIAVTFTESVKYFAKDKVTVTGNPVRKDMIDGFVGGKEEYRPFTIFIFGGSQGASSINESMLESLEYIQNFNKEIHIIHQTGHKDYNRAKGEYEKRGISADVYPFVKQMAECYAQSDLVICRAGATTLAELAACGKPSILIPYPFAANNHQEINARALQEEGAAEILLDKDLNGKALADTIRLFINNTEKIRDMGFKSKSLAKLDAAEKIVDICYSMLKK